MGAPSRCRRCSAPTDPGVRWCSGCGAEVAENTPTAEGEAPHGAYLLVSIPGNQVRKSRLTTPVVRLGRARECEVVVQDPRVSRIHATLELRDGSYSLVDARSTGGTFLDGRPVHDGMTVAEGATIRLGRDMERPVTLVYHEEDGPPLSDSRSN